MDNPIPGHIKVFSKSQISHVLICPFNLNIGSSKRKSLRITFWIFREVPVQVKTPNKTMRVYCKHESQQPKDRLWCTSLVVRVLAKHLMGFQKTVRGPRFEPLDLSLTSVLSFQLHFAFCVWNWVYFWLVVVTTAFNQVYASAFGNSKWNSQC